MYYQHHSYVAKKTLEQNQLWLTRKGCTGQYRYCICIKQYFVSLVSLSHDLPEETWVYEWHTEDKGVGARDILSKKANQMYSAPHKPYTKTQASYSLTLSYYTSIALCHFSWSWMICLTILIKSQTSNAGAPIENIEKQSTTCHLSPYLSASLMHAVTWLYTCRIFPRHPRKTSLPFPS